ncbi:MAG: long-chain fatty acid--CoA ligase [Pedosphaera sp.]|nr:long-chain fatty acid--CoA ligase [Pedosphaera sp.]
MNLFLAFADSANKRLDKVAMYWGDAQFTYGQVLSQSQAVSRQLVERFGVKPGDRVGIWLKNCPEFVMAMFGILGAGAVVVPINNFLKAPEVEYILTDANVNLLVSDSAMAEGFQQLKSTRPELESFQIEEFPTLDGDRGSISANHRDESDLAVIIYTSGTTGRPKGAMLSHGNLLHNVESCRLVLEVVSFDRFAVLLPMFHSFMLTVGILLPLSIGGSMVLMKSIHPPKSVINEIMAHQATILPAIPQFFRALIAAQLPGNLPLRICVSGAAPLPVEVLKEFNEKIPVPLIEGYGLSEASPVCSMNPIQGPWKAGSIGRPVPDVEMSVQDDAGRELGIREVGEICIRGGNVMQGYWNQPEETAKALRAGWLLTGDVGYRDEDGYFYITDRKKDMLLVNGINVYPREIEEVLYRIRGVKEAAVIGMPDARKGEHAVAFIATDEGFVLDEKVVLQHVRVSLADYKVPRRVVFLTSLPRNATGKILKTELRRMQVA